MFFGNFVAKKPENKRITRGSNGFLIRGSGVRVTPGARQFTRAGVPAVSLTTRFVIFGFTALAAGLFPFRLATFASPTRGLCVG